jgi:hypothetical protein
MGNRRRKNEPGVEGVGDWVEELHGAAPELRDGSARSLEGPGWRCTVVPQRWHNSAVGAEGEGGRKGPSRGQAPFIAGKGGKLWVRQVDSGHGLEWSARSECGRSVVRTGRLTGGPSGFDIFLELFKPAQTWKLKMDALRCSKTSQILHAARLEAL